MLKTMGSVSIVIPSLNDAEMLRACLDALTVQTRQPDEIIVVDNGSADDTTAVALAAGARVVHEPVRGVLRATAAGFDAASGEIIGRLDADSIPAPGWVARLEERFDADPTLTALTGTGRFYGKNAFWRFVGQYIYIGGYLFVIRAAIGHVPLFGSNFAMRRGAWAEIRESLHIETPEVHDDLDISFALRPGMGVEFDAALHVAVSARPLDTWAGFAHRAGVAFRMFAVAYREIGWAERVRSSARGRRRRRARRRELGIVIRRRGAVPASPR